MGKKVAEGKLTETDLAELKKDEENLERSAHEIRSENTKLDFDQVKKSEDLEVKIATITTTATLGSNNIGF